jgi:hypothetical protein
MCFWLVLIDSRYIVPIDTVTLMSPCIDEGGDGEVDRVSDDGVGNEEW